MAGLQEGRKRDGVNNKGIAFYNNLINELIANGAQTSALTLNYENAKYIFLISICVPYDTGAGIKPYVTLFHWDLPQSLEDEYNGFLSPNVVEDFRDYADLCFEKFGDRVKHWITLNEPWTFSFYGYGLGTLAPGRGGSSNYKLSALKEFMPSSRYIDPQAFMQKRTVTTTFGDLGKKLSGKECKDDNSGNPGTEPYTVTHNQLLAHAEAVKLYRDKYQIKQNGKIGITLVSRWFIPRTHSTSDRNAAERAIDFTYMDPLTVGRYPHIMRSIVKERLPKFTEEQAHMLKGSFDFIGLNYYTTNYAAHAPNADNRNPHIVTDRMVKYSTELNGVPIGDEATIIYPFYMLIFSTMLQGGSSWLYVYPKGFMDLLLYIKTKYKNPCIYVTENGLDEKTDATLPLWESLSDHKRVCYHHHHLCFLKKATREYDINVKGYFTWSLLDNFEWASGVSVRFGNIYVDYDDKCKRYRKLSAEWFKLHLLNEDSDSESSCPEEPDSDSSDSDSQEAKLESGPKMTIT
ncbi:hypothetical protein RJ639_001617 [Escallonia herrerae]|uniref:Beta-glucosidase n=1 Tax=Escallonia herrerae TaxID=1293975 RepID=A0AA89BGR4_9ASTE|nr:hypothetical protein RJ639_001617 [Escallonia herrerae]